MQSGGTALEEIIVSARKRDESVLDVPVAINVFTAADIEAAGIERPQDFIDLTPNMSLVQTQNQGTSFVTVRGISQARNSEPSVAVLIDGVLMANPSQFNQELVDIESIQVLKGPQGALIRSQRHWWRDHRQYASSRRTRSRAASPPATSPVPARGCVAASAVRSADTLKYRAAFRISKPMATSIMRSWTRRRIPSATCRLGCACCGSRRRVSLPTLRFNSSQVDTQALYFNITESVNDTSLPVRVNNRGVNERDMYGVSLKMDYETGAGTLTSVSFL